MRSTLAKMRFVWYVKTKIKKMCVASSAMTIIELDTEKRQLISRIAEYSVQLALLEQIGTGGLCQTGSSIILVDTSLVTPVGVLDSWHDFFTLFLEHCQDCEICRDVIEKIEEALLSGCLLPSQQAIHSFREIVQSW